MIIRTSARFLRPFTRCGLCSNGFKTSWGSQREEQIMNVFDRKAKLQQRERAAQSEDVESYDYLKEEIGYRLADRVLDIKRSMDACVDIGSSRGYVSRHLTGQSIKKLYVTEMSPTMLDQCQLPDKSENIQTEKILLDEDNVRLPFEDESVQLVTSSLSMHWVNNLPGLFKEVDRILAKDGVFLGAMFGGDTLFELRCSLQMAELERQGGIASHISPFVEVQDLGNLLNRVGFKMLTIDNDTLKVSFSSIVRLMYDLKGMAENNAALGRQLCLKRDTLLAAEAIYRELYSDDQESLPATFQIFYWIGWKPGPLQPEPLKPQKSDVSLQNLESLEHVVKELTSDDDKSNKK